MEDVNDEYFTASLGLQSQDFSPFCLTTVLGFLVLLFVVYWYWEMNTTVDGCAFCDIVRSKKEAHLRTTDKCVVIKDHKPKVPHHYLIVSKCHINKPTDLTPADIELVKEMEQTGREVLRAQLKATGEADTVEDMLRTGFHWPPMIRVNHLHMHLLYPVKDLSLLSKMLVFKPGKVFRETSKVLKDLEEQRAKQDFGHPPVEQPHAVESTAAH